MMRRRKTLRGFGLLDVLIGLVIFVLLATVALTTFGLVRSSIDRSLVRSTQAIDVLEETVGLIDVYYRDRPDLFMIDAGKYYLDENNPLFFVPPPVNQPQVVDENYERLVIVEYANRVPGFSSSEVLDPPNGTGNEMQLTQLIRVSLDWDGAAAPLTAQLTYPLDATMSLSGPLNVSNALLAVSLVGGVTKVKTSPPNYVPEATYYFQVLLSDINPAVSFLDKWAGFVVDLKNEWVLSYGTGNASLSTSNYWKPTYVDLSPVYTGRTVVLFPPSLVLTGNYLYIKAHYKDGPSGVTDALTNLQSLFLAQ